MAGFQTLNVTGLQPNTTYTLLVYAVKTVNGVVTHSQPTTLSITTPVLSSSGNNFKVTNGGTDMQLLGGTIYAGTFDDGMGQFDPMANSSDGVTPGYIGPGNYGVALNQFGVAAYNGGTPEFYINSRNGNAYFAGTLTAASGTFTGTVSGGKIISPIFSTSSNTSSTITSNSNARFYISSVQLPSNWESTANAMQLIMDPGDTTRYDTTGGLEINRNATYYSSVTLWAPYQAAYPDGQAAINLSSGTVVGTISLKGNVITLGYVSATASNTASPSIMDLRRIMASTGSISSYSASSYSTGDILLLY
jgi:hypothetical protein